MPVDIRPDATEELTALLRERILVIDGAMGTAIQRDRPSEEGYRGERFADWPSDLQGNNDLLTLTQPDIIATIHREYLDAGADIIETNTFNANAVSLADYGMEELAYELNFEAARLARRTADEATAQTPDKTRYVAGALGPTTRTASISPDVNDPGARNVSFDQLVAAYSVATNGLLDGGADLLVHRDHLRHPQRQGRHLRGRDRLRRTRPPLAGHRVRHHHRRERPHAVRPGHRGVLELDPPRRAAGRRAQLRARRQGDAALHRRDVARRRLVRLLLPQRRPAQRVRRVRRGARRDGRDHRRVRRGRLRQPGRRLLRHHARPHRRHRPSGRGQAVRRIHDIEPAMRLSGLEPFTVTDDEPASSTSASAPTSPARRASAT